MTNDELNPRSRLFLWSNSDGAGAMEEKQVTGFDAFRGEGLFIFVSAPRN
jgi:hypothetical protein